MQLRWIEEQDPDDWDVVPENRRKVKVLQFREPRMVGLLEKYQDGWLPWQDVPTVEVDDEN